MSNLFKKCVAVVFGLALTALTATGLWAAAADEEPAAAMEKEMVLDPTTGKMVSAPEYGGTLTWGDAAGAPHCDPHIHGWGPRAITLVGEKLGLGNWGADRAEISFADPYTPLRFVTGRWRKAGRWPTH